MQSKDKTALFTTRYLVQVSRPYVPFALCRALLSAWPPRRGGFDVGRNEGPSLPDSRRKTGSLAPSSLSDLRVRSRLGCGMVSPETVKDANVPARNTAGQHLRSHRKGLDIDAKFATKHMACTGTVYRGPMVSVHHWPRNAQPAPGAPCLSGRMPFLQTMFPGGRFVLPVLCAPWALLKTSITPNAWRNI